MIQLDYQVIDSLNQLIKIKLELYHAAWQSRYII